MAETGLCWILLTILLGIHLCFGGPLISSNGQLDSVGVEQHILQLEVAYSDLKAQFQAQEQKQAAVLSNVLSKLTSTTDELSNLKSDFSELEEKYNTSMLELSTIKNDLNTNVQEVSKLKTELENSKKCCTSLGTSVREVKNELNTTAHNLLIVRTEISDMEQKTVATLNTIARIEGQLNTTEHQNTNSSKILQEKLRLLETELVLQKDELTVTNETIQSFGNKLNSTSSIQTILKKEMAAIEHDVNEVIKNISDLQYHHVNNASNTRTVAFSSGLSHSVNYARNQVVIFDRLIINIGSGYNNTTGIFTCPVSGIYNFQLHALTNAAKILIFQLLHNNNIVSTVYGTDEHTYIGASNSVIIQAKRHDKIWVIVTYDSSVYGDPIYMHTTLTGFLVS